MTRLFRTYWNLVCHLKKLMKILIKKDVEATEGRGGETSFLGGGGAVGGSCENSAGQSNFENIWANIWCKPDWILSQNCRNTLPLHKLKN